MSDDRITATASCAFCEYLARLTGDTALEVGSTLRRILLLHVRDCHPEQVVDDRSTIGHVAAKRS
jgi:hypothetical protein